MYMDTILTYMDIIKYLYFYIFLVINIWLSNTLFFQKLYICFCDVFVTFNLPDGTFITVKVRERKDIEKRCPVLLCLSRSSKRNLEKFICFLVPRVSCIKFHFLKHILHNTHVWLITKVHESLWYYLTWFHGPTLSC